MGVAVGGEKREEVVEFVLLGVVLLPKALVVVVVAVVGVEGVKLNPEVGVVAGGVAVVLPVLVAGVAGVPKAGVAGVVAAVGNTVVGPHEIFDMLMYC